MANSFRDFLSQAGYSTKRADNPLVVRNREDNPPGNFATSNTSAGMGGPSTLIQDDRGPMVQDLTPAPIDNINTRGIIHTTKFKR